MAHTVSNIRGIRAGCVAVFNVEDSAVGTEVIVVAQRPSSKTPRILIRLAAEVRSRIARLSRHRQMSFGSSSKARYRRHLAARSRFRSVADSTRLTANSPHLRFIREL